LQLSSCTFCVVVHSYSFENYIAYFHSSKLVYHGTPNTHRCTTQQRYNVVRVGYILYRVTCIRLVCKTYPWSDASTIRQKLYLFFTSLLFINLFIYLYIHKPQFSPKRSIQKYSYFKIYPTEEQLFLKYKYILPKFYLKTNSINRIQVNVKMCNEFLWDSV
jgi:hypothetical protein